LRSTLDGPNAPVAIAGGGGFREHGEGDDALMRTHARTANADSVSRSAADLPASRRTGSTPAVAADQRPAASQIAQLAALTNRTGLPDALKSGAEELSGHSLDHVRVHRNSAKPAQLDALAYAQDSEIHVAPGQEKHLPHETWHIVQQAQGRVRPTMQAKGVAINADPRLETEADRLGAAALRVGQRVQSPSAGRGEARQKPQRKPDAVQRVMQRASDYDGLLPAHEALGQSYTFQGAANTTFTYHHIIPENKLATAVIKLKAILAAAPAAASAGNAALHQSSATLQADAAEQQLLTRVKNTTHAVNAMFLADTVAVSESSVETALRANAALPGLWAAVKTLVINAMSELLRRKKDALRKGLIAIFKTQAFERAVTLRNTASIDEGLAELVAATGVDHNAVPLLDVVTLRGLLLANAGNKAERLVAVSEHLAGVSAETFTTNNYPTVTAGGTTADTLKGILRANGLAADAHTDDPLLYAVQWNQGNIHRGPSSTLRVSSGAHHDPLLDDGGDAFETAAVNLVSLGHFQELQALNGELTILNAAVVAPPTPATIALARTVLDRMHTIHQHGLTQFNPAQWHQVNVGGADKARLVANPGKQHAARAAGAIP
jgi:hypothetical protein